MNKLLKIGHLIGLALFVGSVCGHILLGKIVDPDTDLAAFAALMQAKRVNVQVLTIPGLGLMLLTGFTLMVRRGVRPTRDLWLGAKLLLVTLITLNGLLILGPLSGDMATVAQNAVQAGVLPAGFAAMEQREALFGAVNMTMILAVIGLAAAKPALRRGSGIKTRSGGAAQ